MIFFLEKVFDFHLNTTQSSGKENWERKKKKKKKSTVGAYTSTALSEMDKNDDTRN